MENIQSNKTKKRMKRSAGILRDPWDKIKQNNICITGGPEGEERERKGQKKKAIEEIIAVFFKSFG